MAPVDHRPPEPVQAAQPDTRLDLGRIRKASQEISRAFRDSPQLLGGSALATGVGHVFKSLSPATEVLCVQPKGAPAMALSWRARAVVTTARTHTMADGVAGRFPIPAVLRDLLATAGHVPLVEEESIVAGMRVLYRNAALVVQPSAALGVAAILEDPLRYRGKRVAAVICGSTVWSDPSSAWMKE